MATLNSETSRRRDRGIWPASGVSLLVHLCALLLTIPLLSFEAAETEEIPPTEPDEPKEFEVTMRQEEPDEEHEPETPPEMARPTPQTLPTPRPTPPPKPEEKKEPREKPQPKKQKLNRKIVEQQTNEEAPEEAEYLSDQANKVDEETRAVETTLEDVEPAREEQMETPPEQEKAKQEEQKQRLAMTTEPPKPRPKTPRERPEPREKREAQAEVEESSSDDARVRKRKAQRPQEPTPKVDPKRLFQPDVRDYDRVFGERDEQARKKMRPHRGRRFLENYEERNEKMRGSLENFISEVKPGNHTGVNAHRSVYASYLGAIHRKIHARWGNGFLVQLDMHSDRGDPLNDPSLNATLEFVIEAENGDVEAVNIVGSSGELRFDAEAVSIAHAVGPHPDPPKEVISPDGRVYVHWNFWRDQRQCGTFGASVFIVERDEG